MAGERPPASRIGRYALERKLGEGAMGRTYLARSPGGRQVVVKTMHEKFLTTPGFRDRFRAQAAAARRVSGAFTAPVIDSDADAPLPWLATAYLEAPTLAQAVTERGPLSGEAVRRLAAGLAEALASMHEVGVVHGDLKATNILMAADGPRLIDFGITGAVDPGPEPTAASDMSSFGALLCFVATGSVAPEPSEVRDPVIRRIAEQCLLGEQGACPGPADVLAVLRGGQLAPGPRGQNPGMHGRPRGLFALSVAGGAVIATAIALVLALTLPAHSGDPEPTAGFAWSVPGSRGDAYVGLWGGTAAVVYGSKVNGLTAYAAATGARLWAWKPPAGDALCGMSKSTDKGMGAFVYGPLNGTTTAIACDHLQVVATDSGKLGWPAPLSLTSGASGGGSANQSGLKALSIGDGVVSAAYYGTADARSAGTDPDLLAASLATGKSLWATNAGQNRLPNGCVLTGVGQVFDGHVYTLGNCNGANQVDLLEVTGGSTSDVRIIGPLGDCAQTSASTTAGFFASDGEYLLIACPGESQNEGLYSLRRGATSILPLDFAAASSLAAAAGGTQTVPGGLVLDGASLYVTDAGVTAISLSTGRQRWMHAFPGSTVAVLAAPGNEVQVAVIDPADGTTKVESIAATGTVTRTLRLDASAAAAFSGVSNDANEPYAVIVNGRTIVAFPASAGSPQTVLGELKTMSAG